MIMTRVNAAPGATGLAAESLLATGTIANPYALPTGHVSSLHVGLIAAIYWLFGPNSPLAAWRSAHRSA